MKFEPYVYTKEEEKMFAMVSAERVLGYLRQVERKYKEAFTPTFSINIADMARDSADVIESLLKLIKEEVSE